jgi:protein involved in polysaccharide export with SLBB domain
MKKLILILTIIFSLFLLFGCQSAPKVEVQFQEQTDFWSPPSVEQKLNPGDVIEILFFYTPQLNTTQTIRPDGKISLQLVGEDDS